MADIDFITDISGQFQISLSNNPQKVSGNRSLLNRFELTFLTARKQFLYGSEFIPDNYGGDAAKFMNKPRVLSDPQAISASLSVAVDQTIKSMQADEPSWIPDTEKIENAEIVSVEIISDVITAKIRIYPIEVEPYANLEFNLPITRGA